MPHLCARRFAMFRYEGGAAVRADSLFFSRG